MRMFRRFGYDCYTGRHNCRNYFGDYSDEAAIGMVNTKTTAVRVIPAPGKVEGDVVEFGGLLGTGPVMPVKKYSSAEFINRGGRIPAPLQSLKN